MNEEWWWLFWIGVIAAVTWIVLRVSPGSFQRRYRSRGAAGRRTSAGLASEGETLPSGGPASVGPYAGLRNGLAPASDETADERVTEQVSERLTAAGGLDVSGIAVQARGGRVTLRGTVRSRSQCDEAARIARAVAGVRDVDNRLKIGSGLH